MFDQVTQDKAFTTAISDTKGISFQKAVQNISESYTYFVSSFDTALISAGYNGTFPEALGWCYCYPFSSPAGSSSCVKKFTKSVK